MVELADSLDSGSSVHYGRAGSSPASRTKTPRASAPGVFLLPSAFRRMRKSTMRIHGAWLLISLFLVAYAVIAFFLLARIWFKHIINRYPIRKCVAGAFPSVNILSLVDATVAWMIYTNHFLLPHQQLYHTALSHLPKFLQGAWFTCPLRSADHPLMDWWKAFAHSVCNQQFHLQCHAVYRLCKFCTSVQEIYTSYTRCILSSLPYIVLKPFLTIHYIIIITSSCAGFKYFPQAGKHVLYPPPHFLCAFFSITVNIARKRQLLACRFTTILRQYLRAFTSTSFLCQNSQFLAVWKVQNADYLCRILSFTVWRRKM